VSEAHDSRWREAMDSARNTDAEASILGGILIRNEVLSDLVDLCADDFYDPRHHAVYSAILELESAGKPIDVVTLGERLEQHGKLDAIGGYAFMGDLAAFVPTPDNVVHYARIVREHRITRDVLAACSYAPGYVAGDRAAGSTRGEDLLNEVLGELERIERPRLDRSLLTAASAVGAHFEAIERWFADPDSRITPSLPWRIRTLDEATGGVPIGRVTTLGARTGVGKSTLLVNFLMRRELDEPGIVFSNEDDADELAVQMLAWESKVDSRRIRERNLCGAERDLVERAHRVIQQRLHHVRIVMEPSITFAEAWRMIGSDVRRRGVRWAALDYLQNVPRVGDSAAISRAISSDMQLSQRRTLELGVAFLVVSQLNRAAMGDGKKATRPHLQNFSDSTGIENCSKCVIALHRDPQRPSNVLEAGILKNKRGESGPGYWKDLEVVYAHAYIGDLPAQQPLATNTNAPPYWSEVPDPEPEERDLFAARTP
jgi:replicative DNA helicase